MSTPGARPSRLAVLIFTDIVGSTELKNRIGTNRYVQLLTRHDEIFKQLMATVHSAEILQDTGDGYFASFTTVTEAVNFALRFQDALHREPWDPEPLTVRIGIQVGEVAQIHSEDGAKTQI